MARVPRRTQEYIAIKNEKKIKKLRIKKVKGQASLLVYILNCFYYFIIFNLETLKFISY